MYAEGSKGIGAAVPNGREIVGVMKVVEGVGISKPIIDRIEEKITLKSECRCENVQRRGVFQFTRDFEVLITFGLQLPAFHGFTLSARDKQASKQGSNDARLVVLYE